MICQFSIFQITFLEAWDEDVLLKARGAQNFRMVEDAKKAEAAKEKAAKEAKAKAAQKAAERAKKKLAKQVSAREKLLKEAEAKLKEQEKEDKLLSANPDESLQRQLLGRKNQRK